MVLKFSIISLLRKTWHSYSLHGTARIGAALSFYAFLSFFPIILILLALLGAALQFNLNPALDTQAYVIAYVSGNLPAARALLVENLADVTENSAELGVIGAVVGLWTASNIFAALDEAFDVIFEVNRRRTWRSYARSRTKAIGTVILLGILLIFSLLVSTFIRPAEAWVTAMPYGVQLLAGFNGVVAFTVSAGIFTLLYKIMPRRKVAWTAALGGGLFTSLVWQLGRDLLSWWLRQANTAMAGSVIGSVLAFLILVYFGWQVVLLGAELAANLDNPNNT
jgi:membrane protein